MKAWSFLSLLSLSFAIYACGSKDDKESTPAPSTEQSAEFKVIAPILAASCGTSSCHGSGSPRNNYVDNQSLVDANKASIRTAINNGSMPPSGGLSAADKAALLKYVGT